MIQNINIALSDPSILSPPFGINQRIWGTGIQQSIEFKWWSTEGTQNLQKDKPFKVEE